MSKQNDGGHAFPCSGFYTGDDGPAANDTLPQEGMKLRDWFAGQALGHVPKLVEVNGKNLTARMIAEWSYEVADAMLQARDACTTPTTDAGDQATA
jgi:hypothetical protein